MAIRNVITFERRRPQVAVFNRVTQVKQQPVKTDNTAAWMMAGGLAMNLFGQLCNMLPGLINKPTNEYELLLRTMNDPPKEPPKAPTISTDITVELDDIVVDDSPVVTEEDYEHDLDEFLKKPEYSIKEDTSKMEIVKTIKFGGPWHYAQYYKDENGNAIQIGSPEFSEIVNRLKTEMCEVEGDRNQRILPKQFTINGKTFSIMSAEERDKLTFQTKDGGIDVTYRTLQVGNTYSVFEHKNNTTTLIGSELTYEQAMALKNEKEANAKAELSLM